MINDIKKKVHDFFAAGFGGPYIIAIDGMSGSGKSTLGTQIHEAFPESNLFHMDDFFLQPHQRTPERLAEIGGNVDYERFKSEVLHHLSDKSGLTYHIYDCCQQKFSEERFVPWQPLVIIEGSYSHHPYFGDAYTLKIFRKINKDLQKQRIIDRNGANAWPRFESEWIPKENAYFTKLRT